MSYPITFHDILLTSYDSYRVEAERLFDDALRSAHIKRLTAKVTGHSRRLLDLTKIDNRTSITDRHYQGNRIVSLDAIRGSLNRVDNFDIDFSPLRANQKARWVRVTAAVLRDETLPPIELIQVGEDYYVMDGHHRVSAARALKSEYIDAVVTVWETSS